MLNLSNWKGAVEINGTAVDKSKPLEFCDGMVILLHTDIKNTSEIEEAAGEHTIYEVTVRQYMTKKATPSFDFMLKMNNDNPMPMRTMVGYWDKETQGMYHMVLHGDIIQEQYQYCMCCGKPIDNPVSRYFGMGPVCGKHNYINPFDTEEQLHEAVDEYRKKLQSVTWEGWVIKSAIESMIEVK